MNIVYLVHEFPEEGLAVGGGGNYAYNMAKIMVRHGHNVKVIVEAEYAGIKEQSGIEVHRIQVMKGIGNTGRPMKAYQKAFKNICRSLRYNKEVKKINRETKIDIVQSVDSYAIPLFRSTKIPYVVRFSGYSPFWTGAMRPEFDREWWIRNNGIDMRVWRCAYQRADVLIAPSRLVKELVENESAKQVHVIESPVHIEKLQEVALDTYNITSNKYWITFCRMTYRKSVPVLAEIIDDLLEEYPEMKYVMVGKDEKIVYKNVPINVSEMFKMNIKKHPDRFIFMGKISDRNLLFQIIKNSYFCILPTRVDNLPNSILEAMALGKIVISSDKTSAEQLIIDGYNGFLTEIDNGDDLYRKVKYVMQLSSEEKKKIEINAKQRVNNLTPENVYEKMIHIYKKTIINFEEQNVN